MIGTMALLLVLELCSLWIALETLSSTRAFVTGEALWSKGQKNAVTSLLFYAQSHNENDYQAFQDFLKVPLGDGKTLRALSRPVPDIPAAAAGLLEGRNHPEDTEGIIRLFLRFKNISFLKKAIGLWTTADSSLQELLVTGDQLHRMVSTGQVKENQLKVVLEKVKFINLKVTKLADEFSFTLGEGARLLERAVLWLIITLSLSIGIISILIAVSVSRGVVKGVREIIKGTDLVSRGILNARVKVYSGDEIGRLAIAFNQMTETLEQNLYHIQELKDTGVSLKREKEKAEASEKAKRLFLAKMSHEIRTPMNAILGFARLLEESLTTREQQEYIRIIIKSGDSLLVILNDILDFSRMEAGKIVFEKLPFSPGAVIQTAMLMMEPKARQKDLFIECILDRELPETVLGDSVRLNQVLLNLVSNSIKFTHTGHITIVARCVEEREEGYLLHFGVQDTGIGIPVEMQERIFESFEQVPGADVQRFGGMGLGLSIVKQLIELQRGELFVDSKPGQGANFYFRLYFLKDRKTTAPGMPAKESAATGGANGIRVLVVEDNRINQLLVMKVLKKQGFDTDLAENGMEALEKLQQRDFDIIIMDLQMPVMDGYEAAQRIRGLAGAQKDIPIIALSAHTFKGEYERCLETGINDFISKPFDKEELYNKICSLVKNKKPDGILML